MSATNHSLHIGGAPLNFFCEELDCSILWCGSSYTYNVRIQGKSVFDQFF